MPETPRFASLMADNAAGLYTALAAHLTRRLGIPVQPLTDSSWQARARMLSAGQAQLGVVCGLQYVYALDGGERPGLELLAAPVMRAPRYADRTSA